jgi:hypothetical protein
MPNSALLKFIQEARKRGFDDWQIREPLLKKGWPLEEVEEAFSSLKPKFHFKNKVCVFLDSNMLKILEKRAKRNLFTLSEQVEDILRRSCLNVRPSQAKEKIDDMLVSLFSRRKYKK